RDNHGVHMTKSEQQLTEIFTTETPRINYKINDKHSSFFNYTRNNRRESRFNWTGVINGIVPTGTFLYRNNNGATYDHIYTHSSRTVLNVRAGFTRFFSPTIRLHYGKFNPAQLGFSSATVA